LPLVKEPKFTVLKVMSRKIFGEFIGFFPKGLNPFKIQSSFKLEFLLEFIIKNLFGIWTPSQKENCSFWIYQPSGKVVKML
jgi:hypothetical protein